MASMDEKDLILYGAIGLAGYWLYRKFSNANIKTGEQLSAYLNYVGTPATAGKYGDYAVIAKENTKAGTTTNYKITPTDYKSLNLAQKILIGLRLMKIEDYVQ